MLDSKVYTRKFLRIKPEAPLYGSATIVCIDDKRVSSGSARVRILDISPGGLRFLSLLRLPVNSAVILELTLSLDGRQYCIQGYIVHSISTEVSEYEYGFRFLEPDLNLRETLKAIFNRISVRQNRHIIILRLY